MSPLIDLDYDDPNPDPFLERAQALAAQLAGVCDGEPASVVEMASAVLIAIVIGSQTDGNSALARQLWDLWAKTTEQFVMLRCDPSVGGGDSARRRCDA